MPEQGPDRDFHFLDALREALMPVSPDHEFARQLRTRLEIDLAMPQGEVMTVLGETNSHGETRVLGETVLDEDPPPSHHPTPPATPAGAAVPYLSVTNGTGRQALEWYAATFDARLSGEPILMPEGRIGHAELEFDSGMLYLAEEFPEIGVVAPDPDRAAVSLSLPVSDLDEVIRRATSTGARLTREPYDAYGQRNATVIDPFGHRWLLHSALRPSAAAVSASGYREGDVGYVSLQVPNADRAVAFYAEALGWTFDNLRLPESRPDLTVHGGERADLFCCYVVDDADVAADRVRAAGGTAGAVADRPYGRIVDCVDDQGTEFALWQPTSEQRAGGRPVDGGLLGYLTLLVRDSARARAFFGAVLGWSFRPGRVADGWSVLNTWPMIGISGGHGDSSAVPMWRVPDVAATARQVRAAGGTATEPQQQPYGVTSDCTDDQGSAFYLGSV